ncbi:MAG: hypothetical protein ABI282_09250 [Candidatus Baltobacteraceae bacterium]
MLALSSTTDVVAAVRSARDVSLAAYILRPGPVESALVDAARHGARVRVRLEGQPFGDVRGDLAAGNRRAIEELRSAGADARLAHEPGSAEPPLHLKALVTGDAVYLDDRNWAGDGEETIVRDTFSQDRRMVADAIAGKADPPSPFFAAEKHDALASAARLLDSCTKRDDVALESESFGAYNSTYYALDDLAKRGCAPRILIADREFESNPKERAAVEALERDGADVRITASDEKFALVGNRAWIGSANATAAFDRPDQLDWSVRTDNAAIVARERVVFEKRWQSAQRPSFS